MGRKGNWFSTVKKVLNGSDSKKKQKQKQHKANLGCLGYHEAQASGSDEEARAPIAVVPSLPPRKEPKDVDKPNEAENEQNKQALSLVLATAVAAGAAAAAAAAAEAARVITASRYDGKSSEEIAAIKIQTAFRGYLARRTLRGMRGLARLKTLIQGQSVKRQATIALQCMQTFSRLQSQIHARRVRMAEENQALQRQLHQKREKELEKMQATVAEKWDASLKSKEQVEAKMLQRQVAAMRREKALAYSLSKQQTWRTTPKSSNATFMDPNDPHWGWNWLERWMASRPWEGQSTLQHNGHANAKGASSHPIMSVGEITKLYSLRDQNNHNDTKNPSPATSQKSSRALSLTNSNSAQKTKVKAKAKSKVSSSSKGGSWGGDSDDYSRNSFSVNIEGNRRHSIAISPVRDDDSLANSPAFPAHISSVKVAGKSKSQVPSPSNNKGTTPERGAGVSAKKRLSYSPSSSAGARRHSVPTKIGTASEKSVANATIPE